MPKLTIDHSRIEPRLLAAELEIAALHPDEQAYPWLGDYPLTGQTVYCGGQLWTVGGVTGPDYAARIQGKASSGRDIVQLSRTEDSDAGSRHDTCLAFRSELRPVTWTQDDEDRLP